MKQFYQVTCQHTTDDGNGKIKKVTERYLINAVSVTDAEIITVQEYGDNVTDFEVKEVKRSRIIDVTV
tara:strand:- start:35 stop:238 length:204 start_codon:yes stop_codon:yes gene_type:complete